MAHAQAARRRARFAAQPEVGIETWITILGPASVFPGGTEFHDGPLCRELEASGAGESVLDLPPGTVRERVRDGWIDDVVELVGRNATVRVMGRNMEAEPLEVLSMESFLARLGYD
jgi:hypothetical protein